MQRQDREAAAAARCCRWRCGLVEAQAEHRPEQADEQQRDPAPEEEEEAAAHQHTQFIATRMREGSQSEARLIDAGIARIDAARTARARSDQPIALERLKALPIRGCAPPMRPGRSANARRIRRDAALPCRRETTR